MVLADLDPELHRLPLGVPSGKRSKRAKTETKLKPN